jgi:hypothetical protein
MSARGLTRRELSKIKSTETIEKKIGEQA